MRRAEAMPGLGLGMGASAALLGLSLSLLLLVAGPNPALADPPVDPAKVQPKAYDILLKRPSQVGERFEFKAEASLLQEETFLKEGQVFDGSQSTAEVQLEASGTVLEVDGNGGVIRAEYVVKSFSGKLRGEVIRPVAEGGIVVAETTELGTQLSLKDGALTQPQTVLLAQVIETTSPGAPSDDELFGSAEAQPVGASWAVNGQKVADAFLRGQLVVPLNEIRGTAKVEGLDQVEGVDCLHIAGSVEAANVFPADIRPEELENSLLTLSFEGDYPLDTTIQALTGKIETHYEVTIIFDDGLPQEPGGPAGDQLSTKQLTETVKKFAIHPLPAPNPSGNDAS